MVTRNIKCMGCGFEGKVEARDTVGVMPENETFKSLGKDTNTGYLMLRCPSCGKDIAVDPLKAFLSRRMKGYPVKKEESILEDFEDKREKEVEIDFSQRVPCSDGNCIGVINEQGVCNTCGKPYLKTYMDRVIGILEDLINELKKGEDPSEIVAKAAKVFAAASGLAISLAHKWDPNKIGLEERVEDFTEGITPPLKHDILSWAKALLSNKTGMKSV